jgi:uncharacterized membrane protein YccC
MIWFLVKRFGGLIVGLLIALLTYGFYKEHSGGGFLIAFFGGMVCMFIVGRFMRITKGDGLG